MENPRTEKKQGCPYDCGICPEHKSHTALAIIDITNRCNLKCPVCFANATSAGYVYEPTLEQVIGMLENLRATTNPYLHRRFSSAAENQPYAKNS